MYENSATPNLSIIIVNYNVRDFLVQALQSLQNAEDGLSVEYIVVDNNSKDGSVPFLRKHFPAVMVIENRENVGFARANNQALRIARGKYILFVNPDTLIHRDTLHKMLDFFQKNPDCGMAGCKVLNPDGSLQLACRRGFPTPLAAFGKFSGLNYLFPKSRTWGRYNLTYLDPDATSEVEALSGSFMMVRREVLEQVGNFDETFFLYGEDLDLCYRIRQAGWKIYYYPETTVIHYKGESSRRSHIDTAREFYRAMHIFVEKHFHSSYSVYPLWLLKTGIWIHALWSALLGKSRGFFLPCIDFIAIISAILCAVIIRFGDLIPLPVYFDIRSYLLICGVGGSVWLFFLASHDIYHRRYFSLLHIVSAMVSGFLAIGALTFFFNAYAFSRLVVLYAGILNFIFIGAWRLILYKIFKTHPQSLLRQVFAHRTAIWGTDISAREVAALLRIAHQADYEVIGFLSPAEENLALIPPELRILGTSIEIRDTIRDHRIDEIVFPSAVHHEVILCAIDECDGLGVRFTLVPGRWELLVAEGEGILQQGIPLIGIEYRLHYLYNRILKRGLDLFISICILLLIGWLAVIQKYRKRLSLQNWGIESKHKAIILLRVFFSGKELYRGWEQMLPLCIEILRGKISLVGSPLIPVHIDSPNKAFPVIKPGIWSPVGGTFFTGTHQLEKELYYIKNYSIFFDVDILWRGILASSWFK